MGSVINISPTSYSEEATVENWAGEYAKQSIEAHKTMEVLDHPDGSVTIEKLSADIKQSITESVDASEQAITMAADAKTLAGSARMDAEGALNTSLNAYMKADAAVLAASNAESRVQSAEANSAEAIRVAEMASETVYGHISDTNIHTTAEEKETWNNKADVEQVENVGNEAWSNLITHREDANIHTTAEEKKIWNNKADKTTISSIFFSTFLFEFSSMYNQEIRLSGNAEETLESLSFTFGNGVYQQDYISGLSFDSGDTPTSIDYTDSGILNWVGTDCVKDGELSIFQPSANKHYDIVFYFNGTQFIGLVNGFVPAAGNEAV